MNYVAKCAVFYSVTANFMNILTATFERGESNGVIDEQY